MSWSLPLGRVLGTEIRLHITFLLLLAWIGVAHGMRGGTAAAAEGVLYIALIFGCVLLHEFGHVLAARYQARPILQRWADRVPGFVDNLLKG